jgi:hypothetical protein
MSLALIRSLGLERQYEGVFYRRKNHRNPEVSGSWHDVAEIYGTYGI